MSDPDRDFRLSVLRLTLETLPVTGIKDPVELADKNLRWCLQPIDKPKKAQTVKRQSSKKSGQA